MVDDHARMSGVLMPMMEPMEPMRSATFAMSVSVDAPLLPRRTRESAKPCMLDEVSLVMLERCPSTAAASSALRSVATSMLETTSENSLRLSVEMPSSPPIAWISSIWSAEVTCVVEKSIAASRRPSKSVSVPLTVLRMSRYALSMSFAESSAAWPSCVMAGVSVADSVIPRDFTLLHVTPVASSVLRIAPA